jgi:hypothetical protein
MGSWSSQHLPEREGEFTGTQFSRPQWIHQPRLRDVCLYVNIYFVLSSPGPSQLRDSFTHALPGTLAFSLRLLPLKLPSTSFRPSYSMRFTSGLLISVVNKLPRKKIHFFISKKQKSHNFSHK